VKYLRVQNERLTRFWGRPDVPRRDRLAAERVGRSSERALSRARHHGHFPKDAASDGWRETPPDASARGTARDNQVAAYQFYKDWNGPKFPRMIHVLVQHPTPYFDDSYAVNSANNGPYGDAITLDLIPMIEKQFRGSAPAGRA
jgi:hypothetical protein